MNVLAQTLFQQGVAGGTAIFALSFLVFAILSLRAKAKDREVSIGIPLSIAAAIGFGFAAMFAGMTILILNMDESEFEENGNAALLEAETLRPLDQI